MSQLLGIQQVDAIIWKDDRRATRIRDQYAMAAGLPPVNPFIKQDFRTQFWPGVRGIISGEATDTGLQSTEWWELPEFASGCASRYAVIGVTRDKYGSIVIGVTVELYLTAANGNTPANTMLYSAVSDGNGAFRLLTSFYPDTHWIRAYKSGTPDIFATSVNTIIAG